VRLDEPEVQQLLKDIQFGFDVLDPAPMPRR
jgi:hypothetical protein